MRPPYRGPLVGVGLLIRASGAKSRLARRPRCATLPPSTAIDNDNCHMWSSVPLRLPRGLDAFGAQDLRRLLGLDEARLAHSMSCCPWPGMCAFDLSCNLLQA